MADDYIPHDDPRRAKNFAAWHEGSHSATKTDGGSPRVYYHGSNQKLNIIRPGMKDPGAWFTTNLQGAANYARGDDAHVHKVYLKSENPMVVPFDYDENDNLHAFHNGEKIPFSDNVSIVKYAQQNGYDGVHFPHGNFTEDDDTFVVFNPEQIKSATENNGNFDATEPDINKARGGSTFSAVDTDHPAFRSWFGKSVLHDDGVPRTYYHGTSKDIDFKKFKMSRHGIWMTSEPEDASQYALENDSQGFKRDGWDLKRSNTASRVIPVHARIENPFVGSLPQEYAQNNYKKSQSDWFDVLRANGYDGWVPESQNGKLAVALGHPGQIKSALSNSGEYSETGDINKADGGAVDNQQQRELNPLGFYSHAAEMASQLPQERGSPQQMASMLTNKYGVKPVEMEGFDEAFAGQPSVTRDQLVQHFTSNMPQIERKVLGQPTPMSDSEFSSKYDELYEEYVNFNGGPPRHDGVLRDWADDNASYGAQQPKYSQYQLPGGENYREVLLKLPYEKKQRVGVLSNGAIMTEEELANPVARRTAEKIGLTMEDRMMPTMVPFKSGHWEDPNVLAHIRMADRTGPNNEKILHVEEIQSDWGQKGKKEGFDTPEMRAKMLKELPEGYTVRLEEYQRTGDPERYGVFNSAGVQVATGYGRENTINSALNSLNEAIRGTSASPVPTAPYVTNTAAWTDLALKDILREAAEGGYDKVVWTPGAEQAKRYSLSHHIDEVQYSPGRNGTFSVEAYKGDNNVFNKPNATEKEIADTFGREIAEKITSGQGQVNLNTGYNVLSGQNLEVGGEGMKGYYDKIVPTQLSKLLKKLDPEARIEAHNLDTRSPADKKMGLPEGQSINTVRAQSIRITPKMRESIKRGLPTYADGGAVDDEDEGLTAYHGSPYDFPKFDVSKIGTGEGAQAYGHGLYFAESEPVAKGYRNSIAGSKLEIDGQSFPDYYSASKGIGQEKILTGAVQNILKMMHQEHLGLDEAVSQVKHDYSSFGPEHLERVDRAADFLRQKNAKVTSPGHMYEVRINAHPDHMLDWDKPLNEQSDYVKNAISAMQKAGKYVARTEEAPFRPEIADNPRGRQLVSGLVDGLGGRKEASQHLSDFGIKGIRYLDAGSRGDNETPTRNYVVFNHDHVQVKRKYAQGGAIDET
jgi:hypothetical protein